MPAIVGHGYRPAGEPFVTGGKDLPVRTNVDTDHRFTGFVAHDTRDLTWTEDRDSQILNPCAVAHRDVAKLISVRGLASVAAAEIPEFGDRDPVRPGIGEAKECESPARVGDLADVIVLPKRSAFDLYDRPGHRHPARRIHDGPRDRSIPRRHHGRLRRLRECPRTR